MKRRTEGPGEPSDDRGDVDEEARWLMAREADPSAPAPSEQLAAEHAELHELLTSLPDATGDDGWQQTLLKQVRGGAVSPAAPAAPWWRRRWVAWGTGGVLVAAAALMLWLRSRPAGPELHITTIARLDKRTEEVAVGDVLVIRATPQGTTDLRVFRSSGELVARCPGGPACAAASPDELRIELVLDAPDRYQVILAVGLKQLLPASNLDTYVEAARAASASVMARQVEAH